MGVVKILALTIVVLLTGCSTAPKKKKPVSIKTTHFVEGAFTELDGWDSDHHEKSFNTFVRSCHKIVKRKSKTHKAGDDLPKWKNTCHAAIKLANSFGYIDQLKGPKLARARSLSKEFFEKNFTPYKVGMSDHGKNLTFNARFTGYYEIELQGTRRKDPKFPYPIYSNPKNLKEIKGSHLITRKAINNGSLKGQNLEIAWVNDLPRLYFLQIQGSGTINLKEVGSIPLVWSGQNGYKFKQLPSEYSGSTLTVMKKLRVNGKKGFDDMNLNQSYIFFKERREPFPLGAQGVMLTPERTAAIDSRIYSYGIPIWIKAKLPYVSGYSNGEKYNRLLIAQDRGGAIKGGARLDLFFGRGRRAENVAGAFNVLGDMYLLYPKGIKLPDRFSLD
jgi:membrane-bound lytic murein transglycosylase A